MRLPSESCISQCLQHTLSNTFRDHLDNSPVSPVTSLNEPHNVARGSDLLALTGRVIFWGDFRGHAPVSYTQHYSPGDSTRFFGGCVWLGAPCPLTPTKRGNFFCLPLTGFVGGSTPPCWEEPSFLFSGQGEAKCAEPQGPKGGERG